ncbi:DUF1513 domain-containing protein [Dinoroseobacter sp. S76]|uniref:DUF1513 domain-containing protein n=1 Tax=Dinoroseobacter sp. S76 TaxID=3415124 RepID=UPI003C7E7C1B
MTRAVPDRRAFLGGLLAAGAMPMPSWADAGAPAYLSAAGRPDGRAVLCGLSAELEILFELPLPARGHAAAAHPSRPEAVAFARRPGTFAIVLDCRTGAAAARLEAPAGRHFYGHGVFSRSGDWLFTTENDYETGTGAVGVWDVQAGYRRAGSFASGGVGPHDIRRLPTTETLVVANGGIETHPETGRTKLNLPTMAPNLAYLRDGAVIDTARLPQDLHMNSIRHLAVAETGTVAFGMQWQGDGLSPALVGLHRVGQKIRLCAAPPDALRALRGYIGSVAVSRAGTTIAATSPRGGVIHLYDAGQGSLTRAIPLEDVSGVDLHRDGFAVTAGTGALRSLSAGASGYARSVQGLAWDNHLVRV